MLKELGRSVGHTGIREQIATISQTYLRTQAETKVQRKVEGRHGLPKEDLTIFRVKDFTIWGMNIHPSLKPLQNVVECLPHIRS